MRQAGRYLEEYRSVRSRHSLLEICKTPAVAAEVTIQPVDRLGVDAAILFADILLPVEPLGVGLQFVAGDGPQIARPIHGAEDVDRLREVDVAADLGFVAESIARIVRDLDGRVPLIGFAGAPFTVASYLIEGGHSRAFAATKKLMYSEPEAWGRLMSRLARLTLDYLRMQIAAGADAVQLFDSWVGALGPSDYRRYVLPHSRAVLEPLERSGVPVIHFGTQTATLLRHMREAGGTVMGVDWRTPLAEGWEAVGAGVAVQGNLDPIALLAPWPVLREATSEVLRGAAGRAGHVFNLGHGILPETPVAAAVELVRFVHEETAARRPGSGG